jgi:carbon starvation protein
VTLLPMIFVATTTTTTGYYEITGKFYRMWLDPLTRFKGALNIGLTLMLLTCVALILTSGFARWLGMLRAPKKVEAEV